MRRDVQLYIQKSEQFYSSIGEDNLVVDGNFSNGTTSWSETSGVSYVTGQANMHITSGVLEYIQQSIPFVGGKEYKVTLDVFCELVDVGNEIMLQDNSSDLGGLLTSETTVALSEDFNRLSFNFTANANSDIIRVSRATASGNYGFSVSNVEIREISEPYIEYENVQLDLFDFEDINITDKIKDVRDISKIFTEFSQQFTVPASKKNNELFSHFYNADVSSGFDQRIKHKAFIKIGGADYKEGRVSLTGSSMKKGMPYSYSLIFYGKTVELKDLIGDDELKDLSGTLLDNFNFIYSDTLALNGFTNGFDFQEYNQTLNTTTLNSDGNPDFFFPMISADSYYFYDSNDGVNPKDRVDSRNIFPSATTSPRGVYYKDLKPAIKSKFIIRAIQEKYGFEFSDDFFNNNNEQYERLSLLLHREKGNIGNQLEEESRIISLSELQIDYQNFMDDHRGGYSLPFNDVLNEVDYPITQDELMWSRRKYRAVTVFFGALVDFVMTHRIKFDLDVVGSGDYSIEIYDANNNTDAFKQIVNTSGNYSNFSWTIPATQPDISGETYSDDSGYNTTDITKFGFNNPKIKITTQGGISEFKIRNLRIERVGGMYLSGQSNLWIGSPNYPDLILYPSSGFKFNDENFYSFSTDGVDGVSALSQMPKIKVLDFLTGIFKMFNLAAYYVPDNGLSEYSGKIRVRSLDSYYFDGQRQDISKYVDTDKVEVNRNNLYSSIEFKFEPHKTIAAVEALELTGDEFGYELLNNLNNNIYNPLAFDGGKYTVKLPFEKMMYERMSDQAQENYILPTEWGWIANREENPILGKPILFYGARVDTSTYTDYNSNAVSVLFDGGLYDKNGNLITANYTTTPNYIRPSNSIGVNGKSINFGSEYDEWYVWEGEGSNENSLFNTYYKRYLLQIYDRQSRIIKATAHLPMPIVTTLKMNDVILINDRRYRMNSLSLNLSTGKADLELMNDIAYSSFTINAPSIIPIVDNGNSLFIFKGSTDEGFMSNLSWNVYVDGTFWQSYAYAAQMTLSVADFGAGSHDVYITAVLDEQESQPSATYTFTLS